MEQVQRINMILSALSAMYPTTTNALKVIGALIVLRKVIGLLAAIYRNLLRPRKNLLKRYGRGSWALVTGSSEGIGKAIAMSLAKRGFNVIISARTEYKLDAAKVDISKACPSVEVRTLVADYSKSAEEGYLQSRIEEVKDLDISVLVNNVGVDCLEPYHTLPASKITNMINLNCAAVAHLNHMFIERLLKRNKETGRKSAIVNVSSLAAQIPLPLHNIYSASKVFVDFLSRALSYQYSKQIDFMSVRPSEVSTPMTFNKSTDIFTIMPNDCAEGLLKDLGYQEQTNGSWRHKFQSALFCALPQGLFNYIWQFHVAPDFMAHRQSMKKRG